MLLLSEYLCRNPIQFCHDYAKLYDFYLVWDKIGEYTWMYRRILIYRLKMDNIGKIGWGRTVHEAKTRAALEMVAYLNQY